MSTGEKTAKHWLRLTDLKCPQWRVVSIAASELGQVNSMLPSTSGRPFEVMSVMSLIGISKV